MSQFSNFSSVMESETISKNGISIKKLMYKVILTALFLIVCNGFILGQSTIYVCYDVSYFLEASPQGLPIKVNNEEAFTLTHIAAFAGKK